MLSFLLVEDDVFVAARIDDLLVDEGLAVIGPVGTLDKAKLLARDETLDAAVLDVNIVGGRIDDVADILTHCNIPFLFVTSCERDELPMKPRSDIGPKTVQGRRSHASSSEDQAAREQPWRPRMESHFAENRPERHC